MNNDVAFDELLKVDKREHMIESDFNLFEAYAKEGNGEIKEYIAELLVMSNCERAKNILLSLASDNNYLVRASAFDSLGQFNDEEVLRVLLTNGVRDKSALARSYAVVSLGDILASKNDAEKSIYSESLRAIFLKELSKEVQSAWCVTLYRLGERVHLKTLLSRLNDADYRTRCSALNKLEMLIDSADRAEIIKAIEVLLKCEKSVAVLSVARRVLAITP